MINLTLRHLRRHWRLNLALLLCLTLASALLASFSSYAAAIAARELNQSLDDARPAERNLLITGTRYTFSDELYERLQEGLGEILKERLVIRHATSPADPQPSTEGTGQKRVVALLDVYSFNKLSENVRVVEGRLPAQVHLSEAKDSWRPPPIEAVIGVRAVEQSGYGVGDRLTGSGTYHRLDIVGIVDPIDPHGDVWGEDLSAFDIVTDTGDPNADAIALPLIIAPASMQSNYPEAPIFLHEVSWRITLNHHLISVDKAGALHSDLINFQTQFATRGATTGTGLVRILADYLARLSRVRMVFFLLTAQTLIFVLYTLTLSTSFVIDRLQVELATLSRRGASAWQIAQILALKNLILALLAALLLGPGAAHGMIRLWGKSAGELMPMALPREAWLLSGVAAGFGWLALVLPVFPPARRKVLAWQHTRARPSQLSVAQKRYLDLYLLAFGGLLYWQLSRSGSFVLRAVAGRRLGNTQLADPLLLIGPSLLLIAMAMVSLRIWPVLLRLVACFFQRLRGLVLPLGLFHLAQDSLQPSRVLLLVSLTAGLMLFASIFGNSLAYSQQAMAYDLAGADLRISLGQATDLQMDPLTEQAGVQTASPVFRGVVQTEDGQTIQLLAVDPNTFAQVTRYPVGLTELTIAGIMRVLQPEVGALETGGDILPAACSFSALAAGKNVGDQLFLGFAGRQVPFSVQATIDDFPTLSDPFVVVSLPDLEAQVGLDTLGSFESREVWLAVDPVQHESLVDHPALQGRILDDAQARLRALRSDALAQGTSGAFQLNTLMLIMFSVTAFFLIHFFAAQGRVREFGVLRAMGLSVRQLLTLVVIEGIVVLLLGLLAGTVFGLGLSRIMIPYLSQALSEALAGVIIERILVDWPTVAQLYVLLIAVYGTALVLLSLLLMGTGVYQALHIGDE
jgi:putative ABC transport system permease protein